MAGQGLFCWVGKNIIRARGGFSSGRATGRRRRSTGALIYGSSGYFIGLSGRRRTPAAGRAVYPHGRAVHVSGEHQTPLEHESLYGRYFPVDEIVVAGRSADRDCVKRSLLSVCRRHTQLWPPRWVSFFRDLWHSPERSPLPPADISHPQHSSGYHCLNVKNSLTLFLTVTLIATLTLKLFRVKLFTV